MGEGSHDIRQNLGTMHHRQQEVARRQEVEEGVRDSEEKVELKACSAGTHTREMACSGGRFMRQ